MGTLGDKIAFIGDSYTSGYLLPCPTTERWPALFCVAVGAFEHNVGVPSSGFINEGAGGVSRFGEQAAIIPADASHVFICGGINDAALHPTRAAVQTAVADTIARVQVAAPDAGITVISPMWWAASPSDDLLLVEEFIRAAIPEGVAFIEGGPWIRFDRDELQYSDGHPNPAGHAVISSWLQDRVIGPRPGAIEGVAVRAGTTDAPFSGTANLALGTVRDAAPGWWVVDGVAVLYGATTGYFYVGAGSHQFAIRSDATDVPTEHTHHARYYHPGGDLGFACGYVASGSTTVIASGNTRVIARRVG
jgi:lysophospholipase L1-like esterase